MKKRLPNLLTISRVFLAMGFIFFLMKPGTASVIIATIFFVVASLTDYFDGYFAKKNNVVSNFGKIMDPIADKFLMLAAFFLFMRMQVIAPWMFYAIFAREMIVTGARFFAMKHGKYLAAEKAGKYKTALQITTVIVILFFLICKEAQVLSDGFQVGWYAGIQGLLLLTVMLTVISGISYLWNNRKAFCV